MGDDGKKNLERLTEEMMRAVAEIAPRSSNPAVPSSPSSFNSDTAEKSPTATPNSGRSASDRLTDHTFSKSAKEQELTRNQKSVEAKTDESEKPLRESTPAIDAILGIDFGTRFTKVALHLPHIDHSLILELGECGRLLPSTLDIDTQGLVYPADVRAGTVKSRIEYLKMRLSNAEGKAFGLSTQVAGHALEASSKYLAAFYLASVLRIAKAAAKRMMQNELGGNRRIQWFANAGVPTQYCDSAEIRVFREVAAVAWLWHLQDPACSSSNELLERYQQSLDGLNTADCPFQVAPELAAALAHFGEHRNTPEGLYGFMDIGGGTLDGTIFRLRRKEDGIHFDILSAEVDELGTMAVSRHAVGQLFQKMVELVEKPLIWGGVEPVAPLPIRNNEKRIQGLLARVVGEARKKVPYQDFRTEFGIESGRRTISSSPNPVLPVFLAGGGCHSEWYQAVIQRTYQDFQHSSWGLGGYELMVIPPPAGMTDDQYPRFVVAIGLTSQRIHLGTYRLPSELQPKDPLPGRTLPVIPYLDTKELS